MEQTKISLTRLLNEIKLATKKIDKKVNERPKFFDIKTNEKLKNYSSVEDMKTSVEAYMKSISDLISYRDKCKSALLTANNTTKVKIGDKEFTIAEAIYKKEEVKQLHFYYNSVLSELTSTKNQVEKTERDLQVKLDNLIETSLGKERKTDVTEIKAITDAFNSSNKVAVIDPAGVEVKINKLVEELEQFESDIDFALSEINAKTEVTI